MTEIILTTVSDLSQKLRTILAAIDQSRHAHAVISRAAELASLLRTDLVVLTVLDPDPMRKFNLDEERNRIAGFHRELIFKHFSKKGIALESSTAAEAVFRYNAAGIRIHSMAIAGSPVQSICNLSDRLKVDLVIVGNRGLSMGGLVLGSVSEGVVHKCSRSVMVVKGEAPNNSDWESILDSQQASQSFRS
jgi:nucleotide-binding universal stress UspA family protein